MLTFVDLSVFCFGFNGEISGILELISIDMVIKKNQGRISRLINNEKYDLMLTPIHDSKTMEESSQFTHCTATAK